MKRILGIAVCLIVILTISGFALADTDKKDKAEYRLRVKDKVLTKIEKGNEAVIEANEKATEKILAAESKREKKARKKVLRFDMSGIDKPVSLKEFKSYFHFDPVAQYHTGSCWCYSQTSFFESEIFRLHGEKIKLSEMHTVYYEYIEKALGFVRSRGESYFAQGSESDAVTRAWKKYGIVPASIYDGIIAVDGLHNHGPMFKEMEGYLGWVKESGNWDEKTVSDTIRVILNKHMGEPPSEFTWEGKKYTPQAFLKNIVKLNVDDYVQFQSTLSQNFYTQGEFDVVDNWWHSSEYYNVPLDDFIWIINNAVKSGYTLSIGGDVSEPGYNGWEEAQIIPVFDIPQEYIDQSSRELRIYNTTTDDDHGIHIVGYTKMGSHIWYLVKDSARSARQGKHKGYHFYRDDYIKLKMLTISVHKDVARKILDKCKKYAGTKNEIELIPDGSAM